MKIGMVVNNLEVSGGYQKLVIRLSQQLEKMGHHVIIYTPRLDKKRCYPSDIKKVNIVTIEKRFSTLTPVEAYKHLVEKIASDFEVIIIHDELSLIAIALLPEPVPRKIVWMLNNQLPKNIGKYKVEIKNVYRQTIGDSSVKIKESRKAFRRVRLMRRGLKRTKLLITYDNFNKQLIKKILGRKAEVVYAGADLDSFKKLAKERKFQEKKFYRILSVGVIFPHRRYEDLIKAASILLKDGEPVAVTIVGRKDLSLDYFKQLEELVKNLGVKKRVTFKNYVSDQEMAALYKKSDVFTFINDGFTWGIAAFEAVAAKLPVIITDNIGATDLIKNGQTGWVVSPKSPAQVAKAIKQIIHNPEKSRRIADRAYVEISDFVSWTAYTDRVIRVIES